LTSSYTQRLQAHTASLRRAASEPAALGRAYADYIRTVLDSPLWSTEQPDGLRIPWRAARDASRLSEAGEVFREVGLYIFGSEAGVPRYVGMAGNSFKQRMPRYVFRRRCQCQLAVDYGPDLIAHDIDGFPEEIRSWYRRRHGGSTVRLRGAIDFARHGAEGIWFTLLPISEAQALRSLEKRLIPVANAWNLRRDYPALLNLQDTLIQIVEEAE
jgi:hypothetical protein